MARTGQGGQLPRIRASQWPQPQIRRAGVVRHRIDDVLAVGRERERAGRDAVRLGDAEVDALGRCLRRRLAQQESETDSGAECRADEKPNQPAASAVHTHGLGRSRGIVDLATNHFLQHHARVARVAQPRTRVLAQTAFEQTPHADRCRFRNGVPIRLAQDHGGERV